MAVTTAPVMKECRNCGHPERWHMVPTQFTTPRLCNDWGCKCPKFEVKS